MRRKNIVQDNIIYKYRTQRGITRSDLANYAGLTVSAIQCWECGKRAPRGVHLAKVHERLKFSEKHLSMLAVGVCFEPVIAK